MIKTLHILGVILFMGNIIISAVWRLSVNNSKDVNLVKHALKLMTLSDLFFTLPGVILIGITGHMLAPKFGGIGAFAWIYHSYALLTMSALIWLAVLLPIQLKQKRLLVDAEDNLTSPQFKKLTFIWSILGTMAVSLPLGALVLMVLRPA